MRNEPIDSVPLAKRRCYLTHVAFICDRSDIQPKLPQLIIGNESTFLASALPALQAACPANVQLVRQRSAWNNTARCVEAMGVLGATLAPHATTLQPVLLFDAAKVHVSAEVSQACTKAGSWPALVPAKMTWLLQPLDTDAFGPFKVCLRKAYERARVGTADGNLDVGGFLPCVAEAIRKVLQGHAWGAAFDGTGFGSAQGRLSLLVRKHLALEGTVDIPSVRPTDDALRACFPRRTRPPTKIIWGPFNGPSVAESGVEGARGCGRGRAGVRHFGGAASSSSTARGAAHPMYIGARVIGRTRSETAVLSSAARGSGASPPP